MRREVFEQLPDVFHFRAFGGIAENIGGIPKDRHRQALPGDFERDFEIVVWHRAAQPRRDQHTGPATTGWLRRELPPLGQPAQTDARHFAGGLPPPRMQNFSGKGAERHSGARGRGCQSGR